MTKTLKALPLLFFLVVAFGVLPAAAQTPDCSFTFTATGDSTQTGVSNLSGGTPCANWRITYSVTGTLATTVTFQTSPDNSTFTSVPNTVCSSSVQPPCIFQGTNPLTGTTQGMSLFAAYGSYVRVTTSSSSGTGTVTVRGYGAKGTSANANQGPGSGGGGSGTVTSVTIAGTTNQLGVSGTCTGTTIINCSLRFLNASTTLDSSGNFSTPGTVTTGSGGGTSGKITLSGSSTGSASLTVPAAAGSPNDLNLPTSTGAAGQFFQTDGGTPQQGSWANAYKTIDSNGSAVTSRQTVNFISGTNATVTCVDNAGSTRTDCTIQATAGSAAPTFPVNAQTSTYQLLAADFTNFKTIAVASGTFTITAVASGSQPAGGTGVWIINYGTGVITFARSGQNINGAAANLTIAAGSASAPQGLFVVSDGTNYIAQPLIGSGGGGGGTPAGSNGQLQFNNSGSFGGVGSPIQPNLSTTGATVASLPTSGWTIQNSAILDDFSIGDTNVYANSNNQSTIHGITRTISVPYTIYAHMDCIPEGTASLCGIYLSDGTKYEGIVLLMQPGNAAPQQVRIETWTNANSFNALLNGPTSNVVTARVSFKIVNNSTTRTFSYWSNGAWVSYFSEAAGTFLTETAAGPLTAYAQARLRYWQVQ